MGFRIVRFNEELGDNMSDRPNVGATFVGLQTSVKEFNIPDETRGEGYLLLSVAGMQNANAQVLINGTELSGQNFDSIAFSNNFVTTIVHIHSGLRGGP